MQSAQCFFGEEKRKQTGSFIWMSSEENWHFGGRSFSDICTEFVVSLSTRTNWRHRVQFQQQHSNTSNGNKQFHEGLFHPQQLYTVCKVSPRGHSIPAAVWRQQDTYVDKCAATDWRKATSEHRDFSLNCPLVNQVQTMLVTPCDITHIRRSHRDVVFWGFHGDVRLQQPNDPLCQSIFSSKCNISRFVHVKFDGVTRYEVTSDQIDMVIQTLFCIIY